MTAFGAIVGDTWRQSKHQWVLIVLIGVVGFFMVWHGWIVPDVKTNPRGEEVLSTVFREPHEASYDSQWEGDYANSLRAQLGMDEDIREISTELNLQLDEQQVEEFEYKQAVAQGVTGDRLTYLENRRRNRSISIEKLYEARFAMQKKVQDEVARLTVERTANITPLQKGVEYHLSSAAYFLFIVSMLGFIAACAGYIPQMLEGGAVDLVLSKPIRRWHLYFGKYVGGLILYSGALLVVFIGIFAGVVVKTGIWHWQFFLALPMTIFSLALLYSIVAWVGLWTRSTGLAMLLGYVYYLVVDTVVSLLGSMGDTPFLSDIPMLQEVGKFMRIVFPSFEWLREAAQAPVMSIAVFPWQHVLCGVIWLVVCLGTAYNRFRINDY